MACCKSHAAWTIERTIERKGVLMISEGALKDICSPAVLSRARSVADRGLRFHNRLCDYEGPLTIVSAKVDASTYAHGESYDTSVTLDEEKDAVVDYDCTCPAALKYAGPCKHSIALVLDFNERGKTYRGYDPTSHVATSRSIARYLERVRQRGAASAGTSTDDMAGSISLELTLSHGMGFDARFQVVGSRGAYVLKSITDFVSDVENASYHKYGKKLAFTHERGMFTERSRAVVDFLVRAIRNRRAYAFDRVTSRTYYGPIGTSTRELHLSAPELSDLLDLYAGRSFMFEDRAEGADQGTRSVTLVDGDPELGVELAELGGGSYEFVRHGTLRFYNVYGQAFACDGDRFYRCTQRFSGVADFLAAAYSDPSSHLLISEHDIRAFCATTLPALERAVSVSAPKKLDELRPQPCRLEFYLDRNGRGASCLALAVYGDAKFPIMDRRAPAERDISRDVAAEAHGREVVSRYFSMTDGDHLAISDRDSDAIATLVFEGVPELQRIGRVFTTPAFDGLRATARPRVRIGLSVHSNLVDLTVAADDLPPRELHALLASYRLKRHYHRLSDGSFVDLQGLDLEEVSAVVDELGITAKQLAKGTVEVPSYKAFLLDSLVDDDEKDSSFERYLDDFRSVDPTVYDAPASLAGVLRPYQLEGFQWLSALVDMGFGGILADEMGLGKSVQLISLLVARRQEARRVGPTLIVCPASLVYNWQAEFAKFAPELRVQVIAGTATERRHLRLQGGYDVMVTSYDLLRRDVEDYALMSFWCEVLDEAQYIKNHETLAARAVKVVTAQHRFALTGTPIENRLSELWSIFDFLMPGLLGNYERFRERYERPIVEDGDEDASAHLRAAVQPFILRRLKGSVLKDLPEKLEQVVYARMGSQQRSLYQAHVQELRNSLSNQTDEAFATGKLQVLAALTRLRQICCDPRLLYEDYEGESCKMETIMDLVEQAVDAQSKMLLFSQFTSYLDLVSAELDRRGIRYYTITGSTPKKHRLELVDAFNADDTPVFLISLKAGGTGLNLTGASIVLHADPWWNAAAQNQATDRAHRIGQTKNVTVYKVIAKGTLEERILDLQETKSRLADAVVDGHGGMASLGSLTRDQLIDLLS